MSAGRKVISKNKDWNTPEKYVNAVKLVFGGKIDLDPCSNEYSIVNAVIEIGLPDNGLLFEWDYPTIYVNPPYGRDAGRGTTIKNWLEKCHFSHIKYKSDILSLIPVAPNTKHWKEFIFGSATAICFLYDTRLKFLENGQNVGKGAPMACAIIYWGNNYPLFYEVFKAYGAVVNIEHLIGE